MVRTIKYMNIKFFDEIREEKYISKKFNEEPDDSNGHVFEGNYGEHEYQGVMNFEIKLLTKLSRRLVKPNWIWKTEPINCGEDEFEKSSDQIIDWDRPN